MRNLRERELTESVASKPKELPIANKAEWALSTKDEEPQCVKIHIYNFLITEGHFDIAQTFAEQSGLPEKLILAYKDSPSTKPEVTARRLEIKNLIKNGRIDEAIPKIAGYELLEKDEKRHEEIIFSLLSLKVINLIRQSKLQEAILTARQDLLPLAKTQPERVGVLQKVMSLIAFVDLKECQNSFFLSPSYKNELAEEVNSYLLGKNNSESIKIILNINKWLQKRLESYLTFPHLNPWTSDLYQQ